VEGKTAHVENGHGVGDEGVNGKTGGFKAGLQVDDDSEAEISGEEEQMEEEDYDEEDMEEEGDEAEDDEDGEEDNADEGEMDEDSESEWEGIDSTEEVEEIADIDTATQTNTERNSKQPEYVTAMSRSDTVIFVLDARAPDVTLSLEAQDIAQKKGKPDLVVLNRAGTILFDTHADCRINST